MRYDNELVEAEMKDFEENQEIYIKKSFVPYLNLILGDFGLEFNPDENLIPTIETTFLEKTSSITLEKNVYNDFEYLVYFNKIYLEMEKFINDIHKTKEDGTVNKKGLKENEIKIIIDELERIKSDKILKKYTGKNSKSYYDFLPPKDDLDALKKGTEFFTKNKRFNEVFEFKNSFKKIKEDSIEFTGYKISFKINDKDCVEKTFLFTGSSKEYFTNKTSKDTYPFGAFTTAQMETLQICGLLGGTKGINDNIKKNLKKDCDIVWLEKVLNPKSSSYNSASKLADGMGNIKEQNVKDIIFNNIKRYYNILKAKEGIKETNYTKTNTADVVFLYDCTSNVFLTALEDENSTLMGDYKTGLITLTHGTKDYTFKQISLKKSAARLGRVSTMIQQIAGKKIKLKKYEDIIILEGFKDFIKSIVDFGCKFLNNLYDSVKNTFESFKNFFSNKNLNNNFESFKKTLLKDKKTRELIEYLENEYILEDAKLDRMIERLYNVINLSYSKLYNLYKDTENIKIVSNFDSMEEIGDNKNILTYDSGVKITKASKNLLLCNYYTMRYLQYEGMKEEFKRNYSHINDLINAMRMGDTNLPVVLKKEGANEDEIIVRATRDEDFKAKLKGMSHLKIPTFIFQFDKSTTKDSNYLSTYMYYLYSLEVKTSKSKSKANKLNVEYVKIQMTNAGGGGKVTWKAEGNAIAKKTYELPKTS